MKKVIFALTLFIAAIPVFIGIIGFFLPQEIRVERSAEIAAPAHIPFMLVNDLQSWHKWSPWHQLDPNMKITYGKITAGEGASYTWESEKSGNGQLDITESVPSKKISTRMDFRENGTAAGEFIFEANTPKTVRITWAMETDLGGSPFSRFIGLFMEKFVGDDFETGLRNLKEISEKKAAEVPKAIPSESIGQQSAAN